MSDSSATTPITALSLTTPEIDEHPELDKATEIFIKTKGDINAVQKFFLDECKTDYPIKDLETYFKSVEVTNPVSKRDKTRIIEHLKKKSIDAESESALRISMIQEILWQRILNVHIDSAKGIVKTKEGRSKHKEQSKELVELTRESREFHKMKLEILGMGKTPEEAKAEMDAYFVSLMKQAVQKLEGMPSAQKKLQEMLGLIPKSDD